MIQLVIGFMRGKMSESAAKLRRLLAEANDRIRELESNPPVIKEIFVDKYIPVPGPERIVYIDNPDHIDMIRALQERLAFYQ